MRLAPINDVSRLTPVTWPPGRFMLATSPNRIGSAPIVKTTGTVGLAACAARAEATSPVAAITSTPFATSCAARPGNAW